MNNIHIYLPIDRRLALSKNEPLPPYTQGTALFADISGFTPLTSAYAEALGPRQGAEELIRQINQVYDVLINEVHRFRGSVIYFSGDAITCWFDGDNGLQATTCALAMQERMKTFSAVSTPAHTTIAITIKIAIAAGPARRFLVGDPAIQRIDVLVGDTLTLVATAEKLAQPGQIVLTTQTVQSDIFQTTPLENGEFALVHGLQHLSPPVPWPALNESALPNELIKAWLLPPVYDKLQTGADRYLSELRPVVPLFLKFSGLDYENDPNVGEKLDAYLCWVQKTVGRFEGYVLQITLGDKGSYLYAGFGAPISHEDDADRAVRAAIALCDLPPHLSFIQDFQMGISRGQMRVGPYGGTARRTYGAIGHETNMAARLMSHAKPGEIVISQRVVEALSRKAAFQITSIGQLTLKGSPQPVPAYSVNPKGTAVSTLTQFAAPSTNTPLLGRQAEQQLLEHKLTWLLQGQSQVVVIEGEAGIGKSRLVQNLVTYAQQTAVSPLVGEGNAIEQSSPYFAWRPVFSQLFQLDTLPDELHIRQNHVLEQLPADPAIRRLAPLLNAVLPLELPENDLTAELTGLSRANKTHELLTAVLQKAAHTAPLLIVLEDAHWLDSASWALANVVSQEIRPLLLLLSLRPLDTALATLPLLLTSPTVERIHLKNLSPQDTDTLVRQRLGATSLPSWLSDFMVQRGEGNPFFCEELAYALRDANILQVVNGVCQTALDAESIQKLDFSTSIEGVITSRIDRLTPAQQLVVKVSSVIGRIFAVNTLHDIHPVTQDRLGIPTYLDSLNRLDITRLEIPEPNLTYIFKHVITQQVAYNLLLFSQRRELHQKVAEWYEHTHQSNLTDFYPLLAYHWQNALDSHNPDPAIAAKAIEYAEKAGDQAIRSYANPEAIRLFNTAQQIATALKSKDLISPTRQAHWALQLGVAYLGVGQMTESRTHLLRVLALLGWPLPPSNAQMTAGLIVQLVKLLKRPSSPAPLHQHLTYREAAQAYELLGQISYLTNQTLATIYSMVRGLNLAEHLGDSPELARASINVAGALALVPLLGASASYEKRAWAMVEKLNNVVTRNYVAWIGSVHKINNARWDDAIRGFEEALALSTTLGDWRAAGFCLNGMAHIETYRGYLGRSNQLYDELYKIAVVGKNISHESVAYSGKAANLVHMGQWEEAVSLLEVAIPLSEQTGDVIATLAPKALYAKLCWQMGKRDGMWETAESLFQRVSTSSATAFGNTKIFSNLLELLLLMWQESPRPDLPEKVRMLCKQYVGYTRVFRFALPTALRCQGEYEWLSGRPAKAWPLWQKSLVAAQENKMPIEEALAHYRIGRFLAPNDPQHTHHLRQAIRIFTELGATYDAELAQKLLKAGTPGL